MIRARIVLAAATAAVLNAPGPALADPQSQGPDVIVGDLPDFTNNPSAGLYDSFAVGTTSCNRGNTPLNWFTGGTDNRHPVIGQNLFHLTPDGRFEQLGTSWLKHGFTALQGSICTAQFGFACTPNPNGTALGVGCSDPYSSGLNNNPSGGLGPRWQVNAATGLFPFPFAPGNSAPIRARTTDLGAAVSGGDRFFVEGQYVCGDDAAAGNKNNNASWREVSISGSGEFNISGVGVTHREQPAIYAWQAADPSVTISAVDVPGDGRFILACKVTGTGPYTYRYALHNLNSHRCAGSFVVPLPGTQGALTNVSFHDVEAVGEPNALVNPGNPASDDWTVSGGGAGAASIAWSGVAYEGTPAVYTVSPTDPVRVTGFTPGTGNDHTANVLRWGTMFNFSFTCDAAPAPGSVAVGLWRPGQGASVSMAIPTPGGAGVGVLTAACCVSGACSLTTQTACTGSWGNPGSTCSPNPCTTGSCCIGTGCTTTTRPGCTGSWTSGGACSPVNPCDPSGACCLRSGSCSASLQSACTGTFTVGQPCSAVPCVAVTGACCTPTGCSVTTPAACSGGYLGDSTTCPPGGCANNDFCAGAIPLCDGTATAGSNGGATTDGVATCAVDAAFGPSGADLWYSYTPAVNGSVVINTCGSSFDTVLTAYTGVCGSLTEVACNDDSPNCGGTGQQSTIALNAVGGTRYLIRLAGYANAAGPGTGNFVLNVFGGNGQGCTGQCCVGTACSVTTRTACSGTWTGGTCSPNLCGVGACCSGGNCTVTTPEGCTGGFTPGITCNPNRCPPLSDDCANRAGIALGTTPFDTTNATTDGPPDPLCLFFSNNQIFKDVWFNFPCQFDGTLDIDTCGTAFDTKLAAYDGSGCDNLGARILACNDDASLPPPTGCAQGSLQSKITLNVAAGNHYTIRVGAFSAARGGPGVLNLTAHPAATGACCNGTACSVSSQASCGAGYQGDNSACGPAGNPTTCCPANFDGQGGIGPEDLFTFIAAWFSNDPRADFNHSGLISVQDIFDFIAAFFSGC